MVRGEPYGNLYLAEKQNGGEFTDEDEEAAGLLADFAGVAIDHARRFTSSEEHGERLQRTVDALDATIQIARAIGGETDLDSILSLVAKRGRALVSARVLVIELLRGDELEMAAGAGDGPRRADRASGPAGQHDRQRSAARRADAASQRSAHARSLQRHKEQAIWGSTRSTPSSCRSYSAISNTASLWQSTISMTASSAPSTRTCSVLLEASAHEPIAETLRPPAPERCAGDRVLQRSAPPPSARRRAGALDHQHARRDQRAAPLGHQWSRMPFSPPRSRARSESSRPARRCAASAHRA